MLRHAVAADAREQQRLVVGSRKHRHRADGVGHPPAAHHPLGDVRDLLQVRLGPGGDVAVDDLLGRPAAEGADDPPAQVVGPVAVAVGVGRLERHAERPAAGDDRDLPHRVGPGMSMPEQGVAGLVVGGPLALLGRQHDAARRPEHDLLERVGEVGLLHPLVVAAGGDEGGLVDEVLQVGADHARASTGASPSMSTSSARGTLRRWTSRIPRGRRGRAG